MSTSWTNPHRPSTSQTSSQQRPPKSVNEWAKTADVLAQARSAGKNQKQQQKEQQPQQQRNYNNTLDEALKYENVPVPGFPRRSNSPLQQQSQQPQLVKNQQPQGQKHPNRPSALGLSSSLSSSSMLSTRKKRIHLDSVASSRHPPEEFVPMHLRSFIASDAYKSVMEKFETQRVLFVSSAVCAETAFREVCDATANDESTKKGRPNPVRAAVACGLMKRLLPVPENETDTTSFLMHELISEICRAIFDVGDSVQQEDDNDIDDDDIHSAAAAGGGRIDRNRNRHLLDEEPFDQLMLRPLYFQQVARIRDDLYETRAAVRKLKATIKKQSVILDQSIDRWQKMLVRRFFVGWRKFTIQHRASNFEGRFRLLSRNKQQQLISSHFQAWRSLTLAEIVARKTDDIRFLKLEAARNATLNAKNERELQAEITHLVELNEALSGTVSSLKEDISQIAEQVEDERRRADLSVRLGNVWRENCLLIVASLTTGRRGFAAQNNNHMLSSSSSSSSSSSKNNNNNNNNNSSSGGGMTSPMSSSLSSSFRLSSSSSLKNNHSKSNNNSSNYPELMLLPDEALPVAFEFEMNVLQDGVIDFNLAKEIGLVSKLEARENPQKSESDLKLERLLSDEGEDDQKEGQNGEGDEDEEDNKKSDDDDDDEDSTPKKYAGISSNSKNNSPRKNQTAEEIRHQREAELEQLFIASKLPKEVLQVPIAQNFLFGQHLETGFENNNNNNNNRKNSSPTTTMISMMMMSNSSDDNTSNSSSSSSSSSSATASAAASFSSCRNAKLASNPFYEIVEFLSAVSHNNASSSSSPPTSTTSPGSVLTTPAPSTSSSSGEVASSRGGGAGGGNKVSSLVSFVLANDPSATEKSTNNNNNNNTNTPPNKDLLDSTFPAVTSPLLGQTINLNSTSRNTNNSSNNSKRDRQHHHHSFSLVQKLSEAPAQVLLLGWVNSVCQQCPLVKRLLDTKQYHHQQLLGSKSRRSGGADGSSSSPSSSSSSGGGGGGAGERNSGSSSEVVSRMMPTTSSTSQASSTGNQYGTSGGSVVSKLRSTLRSKKAMQAEMQRVVNRCSLGDPQMLDAICGSLPTLPALDLPVRNLGVNFSSGQILLLLAESLGCLTLNSLRERYGIQEMSIDKISQHEQEKELKAQAASMSLVTAAVSSGAGGGSGSRGTIMSCHPVVARILRARVVDVAAASGIPSLATAEHELLLDAVFAIMVLSDPFDKVDLALRSLHDVYIDPVMTDIFVDMHRTKILEGLAPTDLRVFLCKLFAAYVELGVNPSLSASDLALDLTSSSSSSSKKKNNKKNNEEAEAKKKKKKKKRKKNKKKTEGEENNSDGENGSEEGESLNGDEEGDEEEEEEEDDDDDEEEDENNNNNKENDTAAGGRKALRLVVAPFAAISKERRLYQEESWLCRLSSRVSQEVLAAPQFPSSLADSTPQIEELLLKIVACRLSRAEKWRDSWKQIVSITNEKFRKEDSQDELTGGEATALSMETQRELLTLSLLQPQSLEVIVKKFEVFGGFYEELLARERGSAASRSGFSTSMNASMMESTLASSSPSAIRGDSSASAPSRNLKKKSDMQQASNIILNKPKHRKMNWPGWSSLLQLVSKTLREHDKKLRTVFHSYATRSVCSSIAFSSVKTNVYFGLSHNQFREFIVENNLHTKPGNAGLTKKTFGAVYDTLMTARVNAREKPHHHSHHSSSSLARMSSSASFSKNASSENNASSSSLTASASAGGGGGGHHHLFLTPQQYPMSVVSREVRDDLELPPGLLSLGDFSSMLSFIACCLAFAEIKKPFDGPLIQKHLATIISSLKIRSSARRVERDHFQQQVDSFDVQHVFEQHNTALRRAYTKVAAADGDPEMDLEEFLVVMRVTRLQIVVGADTCRDIFARFAGGSEGSLLYRDFLDTLAVIATYCDPNPFVPLAEKIKTLLCGPITNRSLPGVLSSLGVKSY